MMRHITFLGCFLALLTSCQSGPQKGDAVAKVNDRFVSLETFEQKANRVAHLPGKDFTTGAKKKELLDEMINQELLFQAALKEGIVESSDRLRTQIAREYLNEKVGRERYEPTDQDLKTYYEENKEKLEKIRASHILIKPKTAGDAAAEEAAKKNAEDVLKQIRGGADFAEMARKNSNDAANKNRGGDLFYFDRKKMVPEFTQVAFGLEKVGDVSDVVKTEFGYHIIKLTGEQRGLDFFRHSMKWQIAQQKRKEKVDNLFKELRNSASIKVYDDKLAKAEIAKTPPKMPKGHPPVGGESKPSPHGAKKPE